VIEQDRQPFLNHESGSFSPTSEKWVLRAGQWSQTYYQFRDGKLSFVENDNKDQQHSEQMLDIRGFIREHTATVASPYPELLAFLASVGHGPQI
jgi:hypothetical protein